MDRFYKMMKRNNKGFTLVELMVVLLILGILVAIAIPIYNSTQKNAKVKACNANIRTINGAISQCAAENGVEPTEITFENVAATDTTPAKTGLKNFIKDLEGSKDSGITKPTCPFGNAYEFDTDGFVKEHTH
jgi:type II secretion system protein G